MQAGKGRSLSCSEAGWAQKVVAVLQSKIPAGPLTGGASLQRSCREGLLAGLAWPLGRVTTWSSSLKAGTPSRPLPVAAPA